MRYNTIHKRRIKKKGGFSRKTAKKYLNSGGGPTKLNPNAVVWSPSVSNISQKLNPNAAVWSPSVSNISENYTQDLNAVALDCEMVGVGPVIRIDDRGNEIRESGLAHVAIVDLDGSIILDTYVIPKGGKNVITNYRTAYSGITEEIIDSLDKKIHQFGIIKNIVAKILKNKTVVGHGLDNDFKVLDLEPSDYKLWDTAKLNKFTYNHPIYGRSARKLKLLAQDIGNDIQVVGESHSPVEDARASMNLYRHYKLKMPKIDYMNMTK